MKQNTCIRIVLRESRGDGDVVNIAVDSEDSISIKDRYIGIIASDGSSYAFTIHNILYYKIYKEDKIAEHIRVDLGKGRNSELI